jgi:hypothetical protein
MIKRLTVKSCLYWTLALAFVAWSWTTLYVQSYGNVWGGKDDSAQMAIKEKKEMLAELASLEKSGAPPDVIFDQRVKLSLQYGQNKDHDGARKMLQEEKDALLQLPESEENFGQRIRLEALVAHTYIDEGLFGKARTSLEDALALAKKMQDKYFSEDARLLTIAMTNEMGVLTYLEANSTLDGKLRSKTFDRSQKIFEQLLAQIDGLEADQSKLTAETRKRLQGMKRHVSANLKQLKEDRANEDEFLQT